jgi:fluoroacetyl-CoA thioesterase
MGTEMGGGSMDDELGGMGWGGGMGGGIRRGPGMGRGGWRRMGRGGGRGGRGPGRGPGAPTEPWLLQLQGSQGSVQVTVTDDMTASHLGSGDVAVLATPMVVELIERAAMSALAGKIPQDRTTVGAALRLLHQAPTPVGGNVTTTVRLEEVQGRRLRFSCQVADAAGPVAQGMHIRVLVERSAFEASVAQRRSQSGPATGRPGR